jgi:hypothetical protein
MSGTQTRVTVVVADRDRHTNDGDEIADAPIHGDPVAVEQLVADVLGRAHRMAEELDAPNEARTIFHLAHSFADELASADPHFDRQRFIQTVTNGSS